MVVVTMRILVLVEELLEEMDRACLLQAILQVELRLLDMPLDKGCL